MTLNKKKKKKLKKMVWTCSLITSTLGFLSRRWGEGPGWFSRVVQIQTSLCSTGVFTLDTQGAGTSQHLYRLLHQTFNLALLSLGNTSSVLQGKSLTALILAGEQSTILAFIIQVTSKKLHCKPHNHHAANFVYPTGDVTWWSTGRG